MSLNRRDFIKNTLLMTGGLTFLPVSLTKEQQLYKVKAKAIKSLFYKELEFFQYYGKELVKVGDIIKVAFINKEFPPKYECEKDECEFEVFEVIKHKEIS